MNAANANAEAESTTRPNIIQQVQNAVGSVFNRPATNSEQQQQQPNPIQNIVQGVQNFFRPSTAAPATQSEGTANAPADTPQDTPAA